MYNIGSSNDYTGEPLSLNPQQGKVKEAQKQEKPEATPISKIVADKLNKSSSPPNPPPLPNKTLENKKLTSQSAPASKTKSLRSKKNLKSIHESARSVRESRRFQNIALTKLAKSEKSSPTSSPITLHQHSPKDLDLVDFKIGQSVNPVALISTEHFQFIPQNVVQSNFIEGEIPKPIKEALDKANKYYDKDEILNNIYHYLVDKSEIEDIKSLPKWISNTFKETKIYFNSGSTNDLISIIRELKTSRNRYISVERLKDYEKVIPTDALRRNAQIYFQLDDIDDQTALNDIKEIIKKDTTTRTLLTKSVVYKGGSENLREILSTQKAKIEGYDSVILKKRKVHIEDFTINWDTKKVTHPIKSDYLKGYKHISAGDWEDWERYRRKYDLELFKNGNVSDETKVMFEDVEKTILDYNVSSEDICKLVFYELKIYANDFHREQAMIGPDPDPKKVGQNRIISVDEGRWGAPNIAYPTLASGAGGVCTLFKISLLTHPYCLKPVTSEFKSFLNQRLAHIDEKILEMKNQNLIWSNEEFKEMEDAYKQLMQISKDLGVNNKPYTEEELIELAAQYKYDLPTPRPSEKELKTQLKAHINVKQVELKEKAFSKQLESSLIKEIEREKLMADYLLNTDNATIYGAFEVAYPPLATIMRVSRRMLIDVGANISYSPASNSPRNLEQFIKQIKSEDVASPEEIEQIEKDLAELKSSKYLTTHSAIALTSNAK